MRPSVRALSRLLGVAMALAQPVFGVPPMPLAIVVTAVLAEPSDAVAQSYASRSSGGYFRPSVSTYRRPPVVATPSVPSTPSVTGGYSTGGYARPLGYGDQGAQRRPSVVEPSAGDLAQSRRTSTEALDSYRRQQEQKQFAAPAQPAPPASGLRGAVRPYQSYDDYYTSRNRWFASRGWSAPSYAYQSRPSFGIWDGLMMWFLLDTLTRPGHADFFYNNQNDPGYQQWRADADRLARDNADLRAKLDALDQRLAADQGRPRDPQALPPDVPPQDALAADQVVARLPQAADSGAGSLFAVLLIGGGVLLVLWMWRRRDRAGRAGGAGASSPLGTAAGIVGRRLSGEAYRPALFRVGMTVTMDPTPFVLAAGATKVPLPQTSGDNWLTSIEAVGTLGEGDATLYRLYLPGGRAFFQLHLDRAGQPDECRYFGLLDEINPSSAEDWGFWIDEREGMIGWPEFRTKDGKVYPRAWAPGPGRVPPRHLVERRQDLSGTHEATIDAMLYAAPSGAAPPAPQTEYVLVAMVQEAGQAWIAVHAGLDVNPATLSLA